MRLVELQRTNALLAPGRDQLAGLVELEHPRVRGIAGGMTLGDVDVAVGRDQHVIRLPEVRGSLSAAGLAECEEEFSFGTELVDLVAVRGVGSGAACPGAGAVRDPDVAVPV